MTADVQRGDDVLEDGARATALYLARAECQARLEAGQPMRAVRAYVEALPFGDAERRTVWTFAVGYGERIPLR